MAVDWCVREGDPQPRSRVAFTEAPVADGKGYLLEDEQLLEELSAGVIPDNDERLPVVLALSDNGPR